MTRKFFRRPPKILYTDISRDDAETHQLMQRWREQIGVAVAF
jgi:hypothetical protein